MAAKSNLSKAEHLAAEIRRLQLELSGLGLTPSELAQVGAAPADEQPSGATTRPKLVPKRRLQPTRDQVLTILAEVGVPMLSRDIQMYARAKYGLSIEPTRFGSLRRSEMEAYDRKSARVAWIAYGLTERGEAVKRLLARSDMPLSERVVGPLSGRRLFFQTTARLCEIALCEEDRIEDFDMFRIFIADHARDLPGLKHFQKGDFPLSHWQSLAREALASVAERDLEDRQHIAMRLTMLGDKERLFGTEFMAEDHAIDPPITLEKMAR